MKMNERSRPKKIRHTFNEESRVKDRKKRREEKKECKKEEKKTRRKRKKGKQRRKCKTIEWGAYVLAFKGRRARRHGPRKGRHR